MQAQLIKAKENLTKILTSKDVKATLLELVERNEINRSLLTLLDENISSAHGANQNLWCTYFIGDIEISAYFPCCRSKLQNTWRSSVGLFSNTLQFSVDSMFCFLLYYHHLWKTVPSIIVSNMRYIILSLL
uniref:Uncharacterized protein n=1 Tax=Medicago truncatula TaxID=3880 RepID=B7FFH8_MEDTR|nr:unknown [Medicago truncatula]AFK46213.1 unknown [Medicago truncatula]